MGRKKELKSWRNLGKFGEGRGEGAQEDHRNEKWDEVRQVRALYSSSAHIELSDLGSRRKGRPEQDMMKQGKKNPFKERRESIRKQERKQRGI